MEDPSDLSWHHFRDDGDILGTATDFTPFHLVHGVESVLPIECQIPSRLVVDLLPDTSPLEQRLLTLEHINEDCRATLQMIKAAKIWSKSHYDSHVHPRTFSVGGLVLIYDQDIDNIGKGKFYSMWYDPYFIHICLEKAAYLLAESNGHLLKNPPNGLYLKRFYA